MIQRFSRAALGLLALVAVFMATWNAAPVFAECPDHYNQCVEGPELAVYPAVEINKDRDGCVSLVRADGFDDPVFTEANAEQALFLWRGLYTKDLFSFTRTPKGRVSPYRFKLNTTGRAHWPVSVVDSFNTSYLGLSLLRAAVDYWLGFDEPIPRLSYTVEYKNHWGEDERVQGWAILDNPHKFLAREQMVKECNRLLVETQRAMDQDRLHQTNLAIAQAKIDGARALEEYYLSQLEPMRQQIAELEAIQSVVLDALAAMRVQLDALYDLRARYAEDMAKYAAQIRDETGRMAEAMSNALARVDLAALKTEGAVADIQADIDRIESDKAQIQALIQQAQDEIEKARQELDRLETSVGSPNN